MIGVVVTFDLGEQFDSQAIRGIADKAKVQFEGMPGLRSKAFTVDPANRAARNFYVWRSEDAARAFFDDAMLERVTSIYGVRPTVEFVELAALVDNGPDRD